MTEGASWESEDGREKERRWTKGMQGSWLFQLLAGKSVVLIVRKSITSFCLA